MALHLVNKSPASASNLSECIQLLRPGDGVFLYEDGVFAVMPTDVNREVLATILAKNCKCYVLEEDLLARGINAGILAGPEKVDYRRFVALSLDYEKIISWG